MSPSGKLRRVWARPILSSSMNQVRWSESEPSNPSIKSTSLLAASHCPDARSLSLFTTRPSETTQPRPSTSPIAIAGSILPPSAKQEAHSRRSRREFFVGRPSSQRARYCSSRHFRHTPRANRLPLLPRRRHHAGCRRPQRRRRWQRLPLQRAQRSRLQRVSFLHHRVPASRPSPSRQVRLLPCRRSRRSSSAACMNIPPTSPAPPATAPPTPSFPRTIRSQPSIPSTFPPPAASVMATRRWPSSTTSPTCIRNTWTPSTDTRSARKACSSPQTARVATARTMFSATQIR